MISHCRFFPSIAFLRALEAFERVESVTRVAKEMSLTQSAVSRQLLALEEQMEVTLFIREKRRLTLTAAGKVYAKEIREALLKISTASLRLKANPLGGGLDLAILPTFGMRWLSPRLSDFASRNPEITVNLGTRMIPFDFHRENFDAAIHFGTDDWPDAEHMEIMTETVIPVGSPELLGKLNIITTEDLLSAPLLHLETRPNGWEQWAALRGVKSGALTGMLFDQFATMTQAAIHGLGLALLPEFLIQKELQEKRLSIALEGATKSIGKYYLVWPKDKSDYMPVIAFRQWLRTCIEPEAR